MLSPEFFATHYFQDPDTCVWQAFVPTTFTCTPVRWETTKLLVGNDPKRIAFCRDQCFCVVCKTEMIKGNALSVIRILVASTPVILVDTDQTSLSMVNKLYTAQSFMCMECATRMKYPALIDADTETLNTFQLTLQSAADRVTTQLNPCDCTPLSIWMQTFSEFMKGYDDLLEKLGNINMTCAKCQNPNIVDRCPTCRYQRYCSPECLQSDAEYHKEYCQILLKYSPLQLTRMITIFTKE